MAFSIVNEHRLPLGAIEHSAIRPLDRSKELVALASQSERKPVSAKRAVLGVEISRRQLVFAARLPLAQERVAPQHLQMPFGHRKFEFALQPGLFDGASWIRLCRRSGHFICLMRHLISNRSPRTRGGRCRPYSAPSVAATYVRSLIRINVNAF